MANGQTIVNNGRKLAARRIFETVLTYTNPTTFCIGSGTTTPTTADTGIQTLNPIADGTINDDGQTALTGSLGGTNTTDNTTTYKEGGGVTDNTSQNLLANNSSTAKVWEGTITGVNKTYYVGFWIYIKDAAALAKLKPLPSYALNVRIGDNSGNYYEKNIDKTYFAVGWNWFNLGILQNLTTTGSPTTGCTYLYLQLTTVNATDTFAAGDVLYDLLRSWTVANATKTLSVGYPTFDDTNFVITNRGLLLTTEANGENISEFGLFNTDATPLMYSHAVFTNIAKTSSIQVIFKEVDILQ